MTETKEQGIMNEAILAISTDGKLDLGKIGELVQQIVQAAPAIQKGVITAAPFVQAIVDLYRHGGNPTEGEWAALKQRLDENSEQLAAAASFQEVQQAKSGEKLAAAVQVAKDDKLGLIKGPVPASPAGGAGLQPSPPSDHDSKVEASVQAQNGANLQASTTTSHPTSTTHSPVKTSAPAGSSKK